MSYYKIVPKSDYTKIKDCHTAAYQHINKALEQDEDKQSKVLHCACTSGVIKCILLMNRGKQSDGIKVLSCRVKGVRERSTSGGKRKRLVL